MSVQAIEAASAQLPRHGRSELSRQFEVFCHQLGDEPIEGNAKAGRFEPSIERAKARWAAGQVAGNRI